MKVELIREITIILKLVRHTLIGISCIAYPSCPGTVVDQGVTGVYTFDFFLQSVRIMELEIVAYLTLLCTT